MTLSQKKRYSLSELTEGLEATIRGDTHCLIEGVASIQDAKPGFITFLTNSLYRKHLANTEATAVILTEADATFCKATAVVARNPYYVYSKIAAYFDLPLKKISGIHRTAVVGEECEIDAEASIGPYCVIGNRVKIKANAVIGPGCVIGDAVEVGEATVLDANVTIYHHVRIGKHTRIASGVVIGSDGFGFANQEGTWHKVPQLGGVEIGDEVDIGANTSIDRGAIDDTVIENGVKLDNLIQIAHNVKIGAHTIIAGCVGIAGSTVIGKYCMIGGASMINGHVIIADHVMITGGTGVSKSIREPGLYSSGVAGVVPNTEFRKNNARFHRLENLVKQVKTLEAAIQALTERQSS